MLEAKQLGFSYPYRKIISDLSFCVLPGEILRLKGPNGAGKSTVMKIIAKLLKAHTGEVRFHDQAEYRAQFSYLPSESNGLFTDLGALANLRFWGEMRGLRLPKEDLIQALKRFDLAHPLILHGLTIDRYSTGMKRRLALCRLMLAKSPLWLLDEPLYGLDGASIALFRDLLSEHLEQGGLCVMVSHDQEAFTGFSPKELPLGKESSC